MTFFQATTALPSKNQFPFRIESSEISADEVVARTSVRVIVVGSKPTFTHNSLGIFDKGFFANGAVSRSSYFNIKDRIGVLSTYIIKGQGGLLVDKAKDQISKSMITNYYAVGHLDNKSFSNSKLNITRIYSSRTRTAQTLRILGFKTATSIVFRSSKSVIDMLKQLLKLAIKGECIYLKPSTGLFAVLLAIDYSNRTKESCEIVVSGIGTVSDGYEYTQGSHQRGHIDVDIVLITKLKSLGVAFLDCE